MADVGNRTSQDSNSSNDDYVNITPEHSSPELIDDGEEAEEGTAAGDREQNPVDPEVSWIIKHDVHVQMFVLIAHVSCLRVRDNMCFLYSTIFQFIKINVGSKTQ